MAADAGRAEREPDGEHLDPETDPARGIKPLNNLVGALEHASLLLNALQKQPELHRHPEMDKVLTESVSGIAGEEPMDQSFLHRQDAGVARAGWKQHLLLHDPPHKAVRAGTRSVALLQKVVIQHQPAVRAPQ